MTTINDILTSLPRPGGTKSSSSKKTVVSPPVIQPTPCLEGVDSISEEKQTARKTRVIKRSPKPLVSFEIKDLPPVVASASSILPSWSPPPPNPAEQQHPTPVISSPRPPPPSRSKQQQPAVVSSARKPLPDSPKKKLTTTKQKHGGGYMSWISSLSKPTPTYALDPKKHMKGWLGEFKRFMEMLLKPIYDDDETRMDALTDARLDVFRRAFTDSTFAADDYETLETIGDKALSYVFSKHVYSRLGGNVTDQEITNYTVSYMSKQYQSFLATELKLHEWVLLGIPEAIYRNSSTTPSTREDLFESLAAAIDLVATDVHQSRIREKRYEDAAIKAPGGHEALRRFIDFIFDAKKLDPKMALNPAKTTLDELGTLMGIRQYGIVFDSSTITGKHSVYAPEPLRNAFAKEFGIHIPSVLSKDYADKNSAAEEAFRVVKEAGITEEWILDYRYASRLESLQPELKNKLESIKASIGVSKYMFRIPVNKRQADGNFSVILIGVKSDNSHEVLGSGVGTRIDDIKDSIARKFIMTLK